VAQRYARPDLLYQGMTWPNDFVSRVTLSDDGDIRPAGIKSAGVVVGRADTGAPASSRVAPC